MAHPDMPMVGYRRPFNEGYEYAGRSSPWPPESARLAVRHAQGAEPGVPVLQPLLVLTTAAGAPAHLLERPVDNDAIREIDGCLVATDQGDDLGRDGLAPVRVGQPSFGHAVVEALHPEPVLGVTRLTPSYPNRVVGRGQVVDAMPF